MQNNKIAVVVVDDHLMVRKGLLHVIQSFHDIHVVAEAENGEEALLQCHRYKPDVVLMDVKMEGMGGIAATQAIRQFYPQTRVLALSTFADKDIVDQMLKSEANGYILKNISATELGEAIRAVHAGEMVYSPEIAETLQSSETSGSPSDIKMGTQQQKVLALLSKGLSNNEIAERLHISHPTARYHVSAILIKLGVSNRVEAATFAVMQGLTEGIVVK